LYQNLNQFYNS